MKEKIPNFDIEPIKNIKSDVIKLKSFIKNSEENVKNFRYFLNRDLSILGNHVYTILLKIDQEYLGYAHLDKEEDDIWLGISISKKIQGLGFGKILMENLISYAKKMNLKEIKLSVDFENTKAEHLYKNHGFKLLERNTKKQISIYVLNLY